MKKSCMPRGRKKWKRRSRRRNSESPGRRLPRSETQLGTPSRLLAGARLAGGPGVLYLVVKMGDKVKVKIIAIDPVNGNSGLPRQAPRSFYIRPDFSISNTVSSAARNLDAGMTGGRRATAETTSAAATATAFRRAGTSDNRYATRRPVPNASGAAMPSRYREVIAGRTLDANGTKSPAKTVRSEERRV